MVNGSEKIGRHENFNNKIISDLVQNKVRKIQKIYQE